jgi:hypothetical protein
MPVQWKDLEFAYLSANAGPLSAAWIHRERSEVRTADELVDEGEPPPADDPQWVELPSDETLGLKQELMRAFTREACPELAEEIQHCFMRRGAWRAFKDLLDMHGYLDQWHEFQASATHQALMRWAAEHLITVVHDDAPV